MKKARIEFFSERIRFYIPCELTAAIQTMHMRCQTLFSLKLKKQKNRRSICLYKHHYYLLVMFLQRFMLNLPGDDSFCKKFRRRKLYRPEYMYRHVLDSAIISYITNHRDQKMFVKQTVPTIYLPIMFDFGFA